MCFQYAIPVAEPQPAEAESQQWADQLETYLAPVNERLDAYLNRRVVGNLTAAVAGIVAARAPLTLSELGSTITGAAHAAAGTERLHHALHHQGWQAEHIAEVLWEQAEECRQQMEREGETALVIWDSSVLEKPERKTAGGVGQGAFEPGATVGPQPQGRVQPARGASERTRL